MFIKLIILFFVFLFHINQAYSKTYISQVGPNLSYPWGVSKIDNENVLVTEKEGKLKTINIVTGKTTTIKNIPKVLYISQGGLLDVFVENRNNNIYVFMCYSKPEGIFSSNTVLHKSILKNNALVDDEIIFSTKRPLNESIHFGCRIAISQDYIFLSLGDRGNRNNSQDVKNYEGSVVRINFGGKKITKNQFDTTWLNEVFSIGHRNPQGLIINPENNTIWSHEHGPQGGDEINLLEGGENYGWPKITHGEEYGGGKIGKLTQKGFKDPKWIWVPSIAPSGMAFYNGNMFPELNDHLLIGSLKFKQIHAIKILNDHPVLERKLLSKSYGRIRDLEVMNDGSILFITDEDKSGRYKGGLYKIFRK